MPVSWKKLEADKVRQTIDLDPLHAEAALELIHRSGGGVISTKCPFFPRHSVVFYNEDIEVASMNICFSCGDTVSLPAYFSSVEADPRRVEEAFDLYATHDQLMTQWQHFFSLVGADFYEGDDAQP